VAALSLKGETRFGFVGAHPIPPINWTVNAFALGAQSVNPKVTVDVVYTNSWYDPAAETEAVKSLAAQGVKVVYALVDSTIAVIQAAEKEGVFCISHHADLSKFAPKKYITGAVWQWGKLYEDVAQQVMAGTWKSAPVAGGFKEGYVGLATFGPAVNDAAKAKATELIDAIASGNKDVFAGPIYDNKGKLRVPAGKALSVPDIVSLDWLVKGVRSTGK
jgi:basic membrane protein A